MYLQEKVQVTENYTYAAKKEPDLHDSNVPRWLNFGYWEEERYPRHIVDKLL